MKMRNWLDGCKQNKRRIRQKQAQAEKLETRTLLSVTNSFEAATGELEIRSDSDDAIVVTASANDVLVNGQSTGVAPADVEKLELKGGPLGNLLDVSGVSRATFTSLTEIELKGNGGDDTLLGSEFEDDLDGGTGNDDIEGGDGDDDLRGDEGDDTLDGGGGDDSLGGHEGDDDLLGGEGDDTLGGGADDDTLRGGVGDDSLRAGSGHDEANGGSGKDLMKGGSGRDVMNGAGGNDRVIGQDGSDTLSGGGGNDIVQGNRGSDQLDGGSGRDRIAGGSSDDLLRGGDDDDTLSGGRGDDLLDGDDGDDNERGGRSIEAEYDYGVALSDGEMSGTAEFELAEDGDVEMEFDLEVEDAEPGTYAVSIDSVFIGDLVVDEDGEGELEYSTNPDDDGELMLPSNFPQVADGSTIVIEGMTSGVFQQALDTSDDDNDWEIEAVMSAINGSQASGEIEFDIDEGYRKFEAEFEDVPAGEYDVIIDGVVVDTVTIEEGEDYDLEYDEEEGPAFPGNFPELSRGSIIELEGVLRVQL